MPGTLLLREDCELFLSCLRFSSVRAAGFPLVAGRPVGRLSCKGLLISGVAEALFVEAGFLVTQLPQ